MAESLLTLQTNDKEYHVYLHGLLGETYGTEPITLYAKNLRDLVRGLCC